MNAYADPLRAAQVTPGRIDQGADFSGSGPIYALGDGVIVSTENSGWPGGAFIEERLADGPLAGMYVYDAENITPAVAVGDKVTPGTVLGQITGGIETGFGAPPPNTGWSLARQLGQGFPSGPQGPYDNSPTTEGYAYARELASLGGPKATAAGQPAGNTTGLAGVLSGLNPLSGLSSIGTTITDVAVIGPVVLLGGGLVVAGFIKATGLRAKTQAAASEIKEGAGSSALLAA